MVITMAKLRMAHASTHGARKSPGPKDYICDDERKKKIIAHPNTIQKTFYLKRK